MVQISHPYMASGKTIALTIQTFVGKVISLLCSTLSRSVIAFFFPKEQASFNFMAAVTDRSDFGTQEKKICHYFHFLLSICHKVMRPDTITLVFWMLNFKSIFFLSCFILKILFSFSLPYAIIMVSSTYVRFLIFLLAVLIPACDSSSLPFHMMCFAYKLNKQGDNMQPWHTPFPVWNQSVVPCQV